MEKRMIKGEIITPMFSSGSKVKEAEFRISELKALMRYTFRIAVHIVNTETLYKTESALFGDAEHHASPLRLQLFEPRLQIQSDALLLHKNSFKSSCFLAGGTFTIVLRKFLNKGENLEFYQNWLLLSSILGGLGKRSRRGRGCIAFMDTGQSLTRATLLQWVMEQLNVLNSQLAESDSPIYVLQDGKIMVNPATPSDWTKHKRPVIEQICLGKPITDIKAYLTKVDEASHNIKKEYIPLHGNKFATGYTGSGRFASSLLISVTRTSDGQLFPIYTFVKAVAGHQILDEEHRERLHMISLIEEASS